jgi:MFS family permease
MDRKWWLVIAGCITDAVNTGFSYFGMSAFFPSFEREFGWSRTGISGAFSLARIESGLLGPVEGYLTDRVGAQRMLFIGLVISVLIAKVFRERRSLAFGIFRMGPEISRATSRCSMK